MVFAGIKSFFGRRDPTSTRGLEQFTPSQQERILNRISSKEAEILQRKADLETMKRIDSLESRSGIRKATASGQKGRFQRIKEFRRGNLERQAKRTLEFQKREKDFRAGNLAVKPVGGGVAPVGGIKERLSVKPIILKAPSKGLK